MNVDLSSVRNGNALGHFFEAVPVQNIERTLPMALRITFVVLLACINAFGQTNAPTRRMAVTIDDLPWVDVQPFSNLQHTRRQTRVMLSVLRRHRVPVVVFVNEAKLQVTGEVDGRIALLQQRVDSGAVLGNHTYAHVDFNSLTAEQFGDEIIRGEIVSRQLMRLREPYQLYFRHPMTHTGNTQEKKQAIEHFLTSRGYKVAPHTIENSDFIFNAVYVSSIQRKDKKTAKRLRDAYLDFTIAATEFAENISPQIFGREIIQTLLIHSNDITTDCLDEMLKLFEARGYSFATLDEAMADPAYATPDNYVTDRGPTWLWRWMKSKGMKIKFDKDPEPPRWVMELFSRR
jgi:peptidoglycan/xylan/chitin deacetylase (PgdA/CDA1 family)